MEIAIDKIGARETKKGAKFLNFNLALEHEGVQLWLIGCQLLGGYINLPSFRWGRKFLPSVYIDKETASEVYDVVSWALAGSREYAEHLPMQDKDKVVDNLVLQARDYALLFPKL